MKMIMDSCYVNLTDSVRTHPNRLYYCEPCKLNSTRTQVRKDADGIYHCPRCDAQVKDITDTTDGQNLVTILGL